MLNKIKELKSMIIDGMEMADWVFEYYELPFLKSDCNNGHLYLSPGEDTISVHKHLTKSLMKAGIDYVTWGKDTFTTIDDNNNEVPTTVTTLIFVFEKCTKTLAKLIDLDIADDLIDNNNKDQFLCQINGEDIYVKPWKLTLNNGYMTFVVAIERD